MASNLRVDTILPSSGTTLGIGTAGGSVTFLGDTNITTSGALTAGSASITGNLGIGGTLTYEDVTNIDSVGLITARSGINVSGGGVDITTGGLVVTGISTTTARLDVGNNGTNAVDLRFRSNRASAGQTIANLNYEWNGTTVAQIRGIAGSDTTNKDDGHLAFYTTPSGSGSFSERLRIGSAGQLGIAGANYGTSGQFLQSQGASSAVQWASVSSDMQFASWRVDTNWSGVVDPVQNFNPENNNVTMGYSSGIFSFPSTGYWHIMFQVYCYSNSDQDNIELHLMTTINNGSSYVTASQAYGHMNNDDGGNLYTTIQVNHIFDVTDVSTHKVKFKTAGNSVTFHTNAHRDESYAIFKRLAAT